MLKPINKLKLSPFRRLCVTIGELPTSFIESMSYYELLAWFCNYLQNTVIPAVNKNAEATAELQEKFVELKEYVDNYFNDLDIQAEIDKKLDEMVESGELIEIITAYINLKSILAFNTVNEMKNATNLIDGCFVKTYGKETYNDGDGEFYKIRNKTDEDIIDEINIISLNDENLIAELIFDNEIIEKLDKVRGDADRLGVGNETYTSPESWTSTVFSVRANRASTQPALPTAPSVFSPRNGEEASLYRGRDSVAEFVANQGRNPYLSANSGTYTNNTVTLADNADISSIKIGMVVDTYVNGSTEPEYSGILTQIDSDNNVLIVDGWYKNGVAGVPDNGSPYIVGSVKKIWGKNTAVSLLPQFTQNLAVGEEMDLINKLPSGTNKLIIGYDCISLGSGTADIGFLARTGDEVFDSGPIGRMERGFVAKDCVEGFETHSDNDGDYLLLSKTKNGDYTSKRFAIKNDGTMDNPKVRSVDITGDNIAPSYCKIWTFVPSSDLNYTLPDLQNDAYKNYNDRIFILLNRSNNTVTLSNGFVLNPWSSVTYYAKNVWIKIA